MAIKDSKTSKSTKQPQGSPKHVGGISSILREALISIEELSVADKLFPQGIAKLSLTACIEGESLSLIIEGSDSNSNSPCSDIVGDHSLMSILNYAKSIPELDLAPNAKAGAESLKKEFGENVVFTSGRRSVTDQCRAMAQNIIKTGDRKWIEKTYKAGKELQNWVDKNPSADTVEKLQEGLESVMSGWNETKLMKISYHLSGAAFDLSPVSGVIGEKMITAINSLSNLNKFLDGEGGVAVWHLQFNE